MHRRLRSLLQITSWLIPLLLISSTVHAGWPGVTGEAQSELDRITRWWSTPDPLPKANDVKIELALVKAIDDSLKAGPDSASVTLKGYPMPDGSFRTVTLQPFELWSDQSAITIIDGKGAKRAQRPQQRMQLLGLVEGEPDSIVQLRPIESGLVGLVTLRGSLYAHAVLAREGEAVASFVRTGEALSLDGELGRLLEGVEPARPEQPHGLAEFCCVGGPAGTPVKYVELAIETDDELFQELGDLDAIRSQVENLVAGIGAIYFRDAGVVFRLTDLRMHTGQVPDPYNSTTTGGAIVEFRDTWNSDPLRQAVPRDVAILLSGRVLGGNQIAPPWECRGGNRSGQWCDPDSSQPWASCGAGGRCEWVGVPLCEKQKAYAVIEGSPTQEWSDPERLLNTILDTAHEVGHLFGAEHADCYDPPIDQCGVRGARSMRGDLCHGQERPPPNNQATVMSTCAARFGGIDWLPQFHKRVQTELQETVNNANCLTPAHIVELTSGVPVINLATTPTQTYTYYAIDVPEQVNWLTVETRGGTGDVRLYLNYGSVPKFFNASSTAPGPNQSITLQAPVRAGRWYILVWGPTGFSGVSLTASYELCRPLRVGFVDSVGPARVGQEFRFCFQVPSGVRDLYFRSRQVLPLADVDLTAEHQGMRYGSPTAGTADEFINVPNDQPRLGDWTATLSAITPFTSIGMTAGYTHVLQNGAPVTVSGHAAINRGFWINLPGQVTSLLVTSVGGSIGDVSLWGKESAWPTVPRPPFPAPLDPLTKSSQNPNSNDETLSWSFQPLSGPGMREIYIVLTAEPIAGQISYEDVVVTATWQ